MWPSSVGLHAIHRSTIHGADSRPTLGAGIGGLALAMGLEKRGVPYTIYEAAPEFSAVG
jgi:hypothetical protein